LDWQPSSLILLYNLIHPPFVSHLSSLMVWLWLMVHSRYSDPSRYKGRALWWHFMGVVVHVKVLCVASPKGHDSNGAPSTHTTTPFETSSNLSLNLMCNQSIVVRPLYTMVRDFDNEMLKALKTQCKGCPMEIEKSFLCVDMGCQM
jgi:hypothetical protein